MGEIKGRTVPVSVTFDFVERVTGRDQIFHLNNDILLYSDLPIVDLFLNKISFIKLYKK